MLRRPLIFMIILTILLAAACQGSAPEPSSKTVPETAAKSNSETQTAESDAEASEAQTAPAETHTLTDARGREVEIPVKPQRVVTLTELDLDSALAVGITPVGSVNGRGQHGLPAYLADKTAGIESVGSLAEPSLEKIVALDPDLILVGDPIPAIEALMPQLQEIAPVFVTFASGEDWQKTFTWKIAFEGVAAALNREAEAEAFLADYQERAEAIKALLPADRPTEASVTRWMAEGPVVMAPAHFSSLVLADVGISRPAAHAEVGGGHGAHSEVISMEALETIDGDWLFIGTLNAEGTAALEAVKDNPLFQQLEAVKQDHVVTVDGTVWTSIGGPLAALKVLDDIEKALAGSAAPASDQGAEATEPRIVVHAMGETEVPANPQQVVVLDTGELDNTLALGVKPVGAPVAEALEYQQYLSDQLGDITDTGSISEPNLETILSLKPDLILGSKQRHEEIYEQLSAIAPTVFVESLRVPWQDNFRLHAEALGKSAEAEQLLADYEAHVAEVQAALGDQVDSTTVSIIRFRPGQVRLYLKSSYIGYILQDVGLPRPASQDEDVFSAEISLEQIADVDADYIFVTGYDQEESELETFMESPLWQTLEAVQNGRVIDVNDDTWIAGLGIQAANLVLDDLVSYLQETAEPTAGTEPAGASLTCEAGFRPFDHELLAGEPLCIPEAPERIVALNIDISEERLDLADGEAIFYFSYAVSDPKIAGEESNFVKTLEQRPLWQTLSAVKAGKAFFVPGGHWWRSQTYLLANKVIDDLFTHLAGTKATTPVLEAGL